MGGIMTSPRKLIPAHELITWLNNQQNLKPNIKIELVKSRVRYLQNHGDAYTSQFNPAV